jgi:hypothetical protein
MLEITGRTMLRRVIASLCCVVMIAGCVNVAQRVVDPTFRGTLDPEPPNPTAGIHFFGMVGDVALAAPVLILAGYAPGLIALGVLYVLDVVVWSIRYSKAKKRLCAQCRVDLGPAPSRAPPAASRAW